SECFNPAAMRTASNSHPAWHFKSVRPALPSRMQRLGLRSSCAGHRANQPLPDFSARSRSTISRVSIIYFGEAERTNYQLQTFPSLQGINQETLDFDVRDNLCAKCGRTSQQATLKEALHAWVADAENFSDLGHRVTQFWRGHLFAIGGLNGEDLIADFALVGR